MRPNVKLMATAVVVAVLASLVGVVSVGAQTPAPTVLSTKGVGKPPPGAGMGTKAALDNPKCNPNSIKGWGTVPFVTEASGPFCVAPAPKSNGGATSRGVTADSIKVVVVLASAAQLAVAPATGSGPRSGALNEATGQGGTIRDSFVDEWAPYAKFFEQWGRKVNFVFLESSGSDEAAQRADALKVEQEKPFAFIDGTPNGLAVLQSVVAQDKIVTYGNSGVSTKDTIAQAPYRWGQADSQAGVLLTGEWAGKELTKRKAQWAGDNALKSKTRTFGAVYADKVDIDQFNAQFGKYGGKLAVPAFEYTSTGGFLGDPTTAQQQVPLIVTKLKASGVTSVFLFADTAMVSALTRAATSQDYHPEWLTTTFQFADLSILARGYDQDQWSHAFGLSFVYPFAPTQSVLATLDWYWGEQTATSSTFAAAATLWLASGLQYAGPTLTPKNFQLGYFAVPARGGSASDNPLGTKSGWGKTVGLPYDEYFVLGTDAAPMWYDSQTTGPSQIVDANGKGVTWYVDGSKRYGAGEWPTKPLKFFDKAASLYVFDTLPVPPSPDAPCTGCPSSGGAGTPAASS